MFERADQGNSIHDRYRRAVLPAQLLVFSNGLQERLNSVTDRIEEMTNRILRQPLVFLFLPAAVQSALH